YQAEQLMTLKAPGEKQKKACEEAIDLLWRSFDITPDFNTLFQIADGYDRLGQSQKALELSERAFQIVAAKQPKDDRQIEKLSFAAITLGDHYRHSGRFKKAIEHYVMARSLGNRSKALDTRLNLCNELLSQKKSFEIWLESEKTPEGTSIVMPYANYSITMAKRKGKYHILLPLIFRYNGPDEKKHVTLNRLKKIIPMVEAFYRQNGIHLNIEYKISRGAQSLSERRNEINIWYEYALAVPGIGEVPAMDVRNWSIFKLNGETLSKNAAAFAVSHEIGHLLGFEHPSMYLGPFHQAVREFGNRMMHYSLMSYISMNSSEGFPDAFFIESQNKKRLLRPLLHPHSSDLAAAKLSKAYLYKNDLLLKEAIMDLKKGLPHAPDKKSVSELLYRFNGISLLSVSQMIEANPDDFYMRLMRSKSLMEKDKWAAALEDLDRIVKAYQSVGGKTETIYSLRLWPEVITEALYLRSTCLAKLGKQAQAEEDLNKFVRILTAGTDLKHLATSQY
ncbi:MAG: tetratricopeptide repeat protein, partial [Planctomycetota bacterium]